MGMYRYVWVWWYVCGGVGGVWWCDVVMIGGGVWCSDDREGRVMWQ